MRNLSIAAAATGAVIAAGTATPAIGTPHARSGLISTPTLHVTVTKVGRGARATYNMAVNGPTRVSAGRVNLSLRINRGEGAVDIVRIRKGHTYKEAVADFNKFGASMGPNGPSQAGLRALRKVVHIVTFFGGLDTGSVRHERGSVVLPKAGHYLVINDSGQGPTGQFRKLTVTPRQGTRVAPHSDALVTAVTAKRFHGARSLPAHGTITFENRATNSPHFLALMHVKKHATRKQVIQALNGGGGPGPIIGENADTDVVSPGHAMTLSYTLPAGTYAEMCFFPDLTTGMPHAFMGMVRIVHLK